jgi:membrane-associated phospholipid phosphatase
MMRYETIFLTVLLAASPLAGQDLKSPYAESGELGLTFHRSFLTREYSGYGSREGAEADSSRFRTDRICWFDRAALKMEWEESARISDFTLAAALGLPLLVSIGDNNRVLRENLLIYAESSLITFSVTLLAKIFVPRARPYTYQDRRDPKFKGTDANRSFFSNHASMAFNGAVAAGLLLQKNRSGSSWIVPVWAFGLTDAIATGIFRVTSARHFPTDVLTGALVGILTAWAVVEVNR